MTVSGEKIGALKITSAALKGRNSHKNLAPALVVISGKSLVSSRKFIQHLHSNASALVVVKKETPRKSSAFQMGGPGAIFLLGSGWSQFGSVTVRLWFRYGAVRAVPVFGSGGSSWEGGSSVFQFSLTARDDSGFGS